MNRIKGTLLLLVSLIVPTLAGTDVWSSHIASEAGWETVIFVYNPRSVLSPFTLTRLNADGTPAAAAAQVDAGPFAWTEVPAQELAYNGTARIVSPWNMQVKIAYRFGTSQSLCEFYLSDRSVRNWVIPNTRQAWFDYTGLALMNPGESTISVRLEAWENGQFLNLATVDVAPGNRYVTLSNWIWPVLTYQDFDTILIFASSPIPPPVSITGNNAQDRHVFFTAQPYQENGGRLYLADPVLGNLRLVPAAFPQPFVQGSPVGESQWSPDENQFTHYLSRNLAVMETEVTQDMWRGLDLELNNLLPDDPSDEQGGLGPDQPVQYLTWAEAVLFANLCSHHLGLTRCYYTDRSKSTPIDLTNYTNGAYYCDFDADGYRLPTEGEWEYFCRAGTTTPFWVREPAYNAATEQSCTAGSLPALEGAAWFCPNADWENHPVGSKAASPWGLRDVHGNVLEWCWDWYAAEYPVGPVMNYAGPSTGQNRVVRGGSSLEAAEKCRSASRSDFSPVGRSAYVGFRLVREVP